MRKWLAILLAALLCLSVVACAATQPDGNGDPDGTAANGELGLVGFCSVSLSESIYVLEQKALEEIFAGKAEVQTVSCDNDSATQISQVKAFALMGADLIIINPTDIDALSDAIMEAHEAGCKVYINGATSDSLGEEYYDCCTVSDEYLCGAYVAMVAKNWIEAHADALAATGDWELAFLKSSLSEETVKRGNGEASILEPYLKDWEGNYVDVSGNIVDEANKVENPAYCQLAVDHYKGVQVEQDQQNGGLNVASILTTNPNTRVFIAYNSLASTQGGQYIVDNYPNQLHEFAFFSAGVMGNEADYMVGSVSDTDGVTPAIMRGACQFGVSAAGGEVADSVARTAYAILYGKEGTDYFKRNPDGIAAWWTVDEAMGSGTASVAHFNIFSGATVQAFDPIAALTDENTVVYWNSVDGFIPAETEDAAAAPSVIGEGESFTYKENNGFMDIEWTLTLLADGSYALTEKNDMFPDSNTYTGSAFTRDGDTVVCSAMTGGGPGVYTWADPAGFTVTVGNGVFAPEGVALPAATAIAAGVYSFAETTPFGEIAWTITLNEDGTFLLAQPDNATMGNPTWTGDQWIDNGDGTFTTVAAQGEGAKIAAFWQEDGSITWTDNGDGTVTPVEYTA